MRKGTVLYVGNFELPDKGASANRVVSNGKLLEALGYNVVFLGINKNLEQKNIQLLDEDRQMYEEPYPRDSKEWLVHMCSTKHIQEMTVLYKDTCMIILYNAPYTLLCNVKKLFRFTKIKVVYDCTEWTGVTEGSLPKRVVKKMDEWFIRNRIGRVADGLIVISRMMEEQYRGQVPMIRIPPLVDVKDNLWQQESLKKASDFEFCFAGMLDGNKESLDRIVEAFSLLENGNCALRIIGVGQEEFLSAYPNLKEVVKRVDKRIIFMGRQSHKKTIQYVSGCDCYIFIRQSDRRNNAGFPTKFAESFTCGMPIITTDISDLRDYMQDEKQGQMLETTSVETIREAMEKEVEKDRLSEERTLRQTFHYETYKDVWKEWMEEVVD